jgi:hypothetical protein
MQLNEIVEKNSLKLISQKTNISEVNLDVLIAGEFNKLTRVTTLGFISIIEREFKADLKALREQALEYYKNNSEESSVTVGLPLPEEKKGTSTWFKLLTIGLIIFTVWFFFTQFDKSQIGKYLPFSEDEITKMISFDVKKELGIVPKTEISTDSESETNVSQ